MKLKIFVSYSSADRTVADDLAIRLRQDGHEVFFDRDNLPAGTAYDARIRDDIAASDLFVFLITPDSVREGSYARAELTLARQRWPNPSGHVLAVLARPTPAPTIPAYLSAGTYVQAAGNLIVEALAQIARIAREKQQVRMRWLAGGAGIAAIGIGAAAIWFWPPLPIPEPKACYLTARLTNTLDARFLAQDMFLDVVYQGVTTSFIMNAEGMANIDVGPFEAADTTWTLEVRSPTGNRITLPPMRGCPSAAINYPLAEGLNVALAPR